ncbi:MAG: hypothetical protein QG584_1175 [Pseudomonadota bacterium]|nr:hypothetical protein [Pseudomonadota bacterium]
MGIGLGGGFGPFRGGISTRGVGGGIGPLSAGTGFGSRGGCAAVFGLLIVFGIIAFSLFWPWLLGSWLAVSAGADNPSLARDVTGWIFEAVYVLAIGFGIYKFRTYRRLQLVRADAQAEEDWQQFLADSRVRPPFGRAERASIDDYSDQELLGLAIWTRANARPTGREQAVRLMQQYLGFSRLGPKIRMRLEHVWDYSAN